MMRKTAISSEKSAVAPATIIETLCHVKLATMCCIAKRNDEHHQSISFEFCWERTWPICVRYWARDFGVVVAHD